MSTPPIQPGMRVSLLYDDRRGVVIAIDKGKVCIRFDEFDEWHPLEEVVPADPLPYSLDDLEVKDRLHRSRAASPVKRPSGRIEVDLHAEKLPDEAFPVFYQRSTPVLPIQLEWARRCLEKYLHADGTIREIVFIHGRGEGRLRQELVREVMNQGYEWEPAGAPYPPHVAIIVRRRKNVGRRRR